MNLVVALPAGCLPCCGNAVPATITIECRSRGGDAEICGYPEYDTPSTPPKAYRQKDLSGGYVVDLYNANGGCSIFDCTVTAAFSGTCTISNANCNVITTGSGVFTGCNARVENCCTIEVDLAAGMFDAVYPNSVTFQRVVNITTCQTLVYPSVAIYGAKAISSDAQESLSVEDTDQDAIDRDLIANTWGAWASTPGNTCPSYYQSRTGFVFDYREGQWRATIANATPSTNYTLSLEAWRSVYAMANYSLYAYVNTAFTTDGAGGSVVTGDVPITVGYDTYVANPTIY